MPLSGMTRRIKVLVVDDSALMRLLMKQIIDSAADMELVGAAADPLEARVLIKQLNPDVLTLDLDMPKMDGLSFLAHLMRLRPMPVVIVSAMAAEGSASALRAIELGAVDVADKPRLDLASRNFSNAEELLDKLRAAAQARLPAGKGAAQVPVARTAMASPLHRDRVIVVGASTGGPEAVRHFLSQLPVNAPPILVTQHIAESFAQAYARRLDEMTGFRVIAARGQELLQGGHVFVAPGNRHLKLVRRQGQLMTALDDGEAVNRHRPSVDVLFHSAAALAGERAIGVLLTGMGKDGAQGLLAMRKAGAWTLAQDEASSVVYGMPREALALGAACEVVALEDMGRQVMRALSQQARAGQPVPDLQA